MEAAGCIKNGRAVLGIELGSTRIKAVLIGADGTPFASGDYTWENRLQDGLWTYALEDAWTGIREAYARLCGEVVNRYGTELRSLAGIGISAMMHGYLPFDKDGKQLCAFRTWRNTNTGRAAAKLSGLFGFNIPMRWSISHLYQAMLDQEAHVPQIARITTLAGYIHEQLSGQAVIGIGEASGMFPIDSANSAYDARMMAQFDELAKDQPWRLADILPQIRLAGEDAGTLTEKGARLLDPSGILQPGALMAPPEGDAGTGMTATNSIAPRTGNVSAGTSVFAMAVLEKPLCGMHPEIDMVTTPTGAPVAMVHANNCTSDINAWVGMLGGFLKAAGLECDTGAMYTALFRAAMRGEKDCGGILNFNAFSGEPVLGLETGSPMLLRRPDSAFTFENAARSLLFGAMAALASGMSILSEEGVELDRLTGHGGFFKTTGTAQRLMASALNISVAVMETAGEGGPWGMALLAAYRVYSGEGESLAQFLTNRIFKNSRVTVEQPDKEDADGFRRWLTMLDRAMPAERAAAAVMQPENS